MWDNYYELISLQQWQQVILKSTRGRSAPLKNQEYFNLLANVSAAGYANIKRALSNLSTARNVRNRNLTNKS